MRDRDEDFVCVSVCVFIILHLRLVLFFAQTFRFYLVWFFVESRRGKIFILIVFFSAFSLSLSSFGGSSADRMLHVLIPVIFHQELVKKISW